MKNKNHEFKTSNPIYQSVHLRVTYDKRYHGKGGAARAAASARRIAKEKKDPLVRTDWTPSPSGREGFIEESRRLENDGGPDNEGNYNQQESPGKKYRKHDGRP